jgi:hypothetical protein
MLQTGLRQEWLHLVLKTGTTPLRRFWIPNMLQYQACLLHRHNIMVTGLEMDIAAHLVQVHLVQAMVMAMEMHHRGSKALGTGGEECLKVNMAAMPMVRMAEEISTMMATLVEGEEVKTNTRIVVAPSAIVTIKVKVKGMVARVEVTITTTKATVEDRVHQDRASTSAKPWMCNPTCSLSNKVLRACIFEPVATSQKGLIAMLKG